MDIVRNGQNYWDNFYEFLLIELTHEKNMYTNQSEYNVVNCTALPECNLISPCDRGMKSVLSGRVEIPSWQTGII